MPEEKPSQSINISGGQLSGVQLGGIAGGDITQNQQISQGSAEKQLTQPDVANLIAELAALFRESGLPEAEKGKALKHLESAKEEVEAEEPDKEFALKNLQRATKVLKEAGETVSAGTNLWDKVKPIAEALAPWFGVAAKTLLLL
ncbi:MAG: hypothetical protein Kow00121_22460 [Elainellaceae cyanobacterium]